MQSALFLSKVLLPRVFFKYCCSEHHIVSFLLYLLSSLTPRSNSSSSRHTTLFKLLFLHHNSSSINSFMLIVIMPPLINLLHSATSRRNHFLLLLRQITLNLLLSDQLLWRHATGVVVVVRTTTHCAGLFGLGTGACAWMHFHSVWVVWLLFISYIILMNLNTVVVVYYTTTIIAAAVSIDTRLALSSMISMQLMLKLMYKILLISCSMHSTGRLIQRNLGILLQHHSLHKFFRSFPTQSTSCLINTLTLRSVIDSTDQLGSVRQTLLNLILCWIRCCWTCWYTCCCVRHRFLLIADLLFFTLHLLGIGCWTNFLSWKTTFLVIGVFNNFTFW